MSWFNQSYKSINKIIFWLLTYHKFPEEFRISRTAVMTSFAQVSKQFNK